MKKTNTIVNVSYQFTGKEMDAVLNDIRHKLQRLEKMSFSEDGEQVPQSFNATFKIVSQDKYDTPTDDEGDGDDGQTSMKDHWKKSDGDD